MLAITARVRLHRKTPDSRGKFAVKRYCLRFAIAILHRYRLRARLWGQIPRSSKIAH